MTTSSTSIKLTSLSRLPPSVSDIDASSLHASNREGDSPSTLSTNGTSEIAFPQISSAPDFGRGNRNVSCLAPVDGGIQAWSFVMGAFITETIIWGIPNSYGVFLNNYLQDPKFASQPHAKTILPLVGTLSSGIIYCSGVVLYPFVARYPKSRRVCLWLGLALCWIGLFAASFAEKVSHLLLCQGILYGIGGSLAYAPIMSYYMEWFVRRRGLAGGIINAGTALGGLTLPPILPKLLAHIGRERTLRYLSAVFAIIVLISPVMKPRLPERRVHGPLPGASRSDAEEREGAGIGDTYERPGQSTSPSFSRWAWTTNLAFQLSILASLIQALAYFVPVLYLPSFASSLGGLSPSDASLTVALLNGASLISRISLGLLSDRASPFTIGMLCAFGTALVTFCLWGVVAVRAASHFSGLLAFGIAYGALAGGWTSLLAGFVRPACSDDPRLATNLIGLLYAVQGIGNIFSTPISTSLFPHSAPSLLSRSILTGDFASSKHIFVALRAGGYEKMIVYVGSCFAAAGVVAGLGALAEKSQTKRGQGSR